MDLKNILNEGSSHQDYLITRFEESGKKPVF